MSPVTQKEKAMERFLTRHYLRIQALLADERGQDLIEYALVAALIAFGATAGMSSVANNINTAFTSIANKVATYTS
jgi:pilus assembly protein Flp/PilA